MNTRILLLAVAAVGLGSCSTIYKSGQTPDDVYYSPAPQQRVAYNPSYQDDEDEYVATDNGEYVNVQTDQDRMAYSAEDNYLRMKVRNRGMWSSLDYYDPFYGGFGMGMSPYFGSSMRMGMGFGWGGMGMGMGYGSMYNPYWGMGGLHSPYWGMGSMYNPYWGMGSMYNPYWGMHSLYNPYMYNPYWGIGSGLHGGGTIKTRPASSYAPRTSNMGRYSGSRANNNTSGRNAPVRVFRSNDNGTYVNPRSTNSSGRTRSTFGNNNSRPSRTFESRSNNAPTRSFTPSPSSGRSSGGGVGGGSAPSRSGGGGAGRGGR